MTTTAAPNRWIVPPREEADPRAWLVCLPHAGAGASAYRLWPDGIRGPVGVLRVQPPGRELRLREPRLETMDALLQELVPALRPWLDRPFALFGHSLGALAAYALTRRLRAEGGPQPFHLFASACRAPQWPHDPPIHELPREQFLSELERRYGGMPKELLAHPELMELLLPILRSDLGVYSSYRHVDEAPLDCALTLFHGSDDGWVGAEHLAQWRPLSGGGFATETIEGGHFFITSAAERLIERVNARLAGHPEVACNA